MKKKLLTLFLAFAFVISLGNFSVMAAKNSDTLRVYKKVIMNSEFTNKIYAQIPNYAELGVTKEFVNSNIKMLIRRVLDLAFSEQSSGTLNKDNLGDRFKNIFMDSVQILDPAILSMILDSFSEETIENALDGIIPSEFKDLYILIAQEAYYILGYDERGVDIIFDDMSNHIWAHIAVDYLFNRDIINGTSDFTFEPQGNVTREQFVKMLCVAFDVGLGYEVFSFEDVKTTDWFYPYVEKMASSGLVNGISDTLFGSGANIKREDMAVLLYRIGETFGYFSRDNLKYPFNDQNIISLYAVDAVNTLRNIEILKGDTENYFNPQSSATRAESAQMIYNFCIYVSNLNS